MLTLSTCPDVECFGHNAKKISKNFPPHFGTCRKTAWHRSVNHESWTSSELLANVRAGDEQAAAAIFERYVQRLTLLARARLSPRLASRSDPEDIVMSAWRSFFVAARAGRFKLERSGDLWRLLVSITMHKLYRQVRRDSAVKRAIGREQSVDWHDDHWQPIDDREPTPDEAVTLADELESILARLEPVRRRVLELRLQDEPLPVIARETGRSERTVRRILAELDQQLRELLLTQRQSDE